MHQRVVCRIDSVESYSVFGVGHLKITCEVLDGDKKGVSHGRFVVPIDKEYETMVGKIVPLADLQKAAVMVVN